MVKIALISCVKTKSSDKVPAQDLYTSPLFKKSRTWAEINCDKWFVLSAKYGLVSPNTPLKPYGETLRSARKNLKEAWAKKVYTQMKAKGILRKEVQFWWLAGRDYKEPLSNLLSGFSQYDPMEGLKIGNRLKWLTNQIP